MQMRSLSLLNLVMTAEECPQLNISEITFAGELHNDSNYKMEGISKCDGYGVADVRVARFSKILVDSRLLIYSISDFQMARTTINSIEVSWDSPK